MHEIERTVLIQLPVMMGVDLSITNEVILLWLSALLTFLLLLPACRRRTLVARGALRNLFESLVEFIDREVVKGGIGANGAAWSPLLLTLFFFILFGNLLGMVPVPSHFKAITSDLSVTVGLAGVVFVITLGINVRSHGMVGFARKFVPSGLPWYILPLVIPIEIVSWLTKPISLAIRLFANMMAGHALILVFVSLIVGLQMSHQWFLIPLPLAGAVIMSVFELFVCFVQAFIFTMLAGIYIKEALVSAH